MARHRIPTASYRSFLSSEFELAVAYLNSLTSRVVIKASGLAAGKGVIIPSSTSEAVDALRSMMVDREFGDAGDEVVIEEYLEGPEISVLAFSDGYTIVPLPAAQDHKRIGEGDTGPNTGGMGAYAPAPIATKEVMERCMKESLEPTIRGMRVDGQLSIVIEAEMQGFRLSGCCSPGLCSLRTDRRCWSTMFALETPRRRP